MITLRNVCLIWPNCLLVAFLVVMGFTPPSLAGEREAFHLSAKLVDITYGKVAAPAGSARKVFQGIMKGVSAAGGDASFDVTQHQKYWFAIFPDAGDPKVYGYDAFTMGDGSHLVISFEGTPSSVAKDGKGRGTWVLSAGSGPYEGASGKGEYTYVPIDDSSGTKIFEGEIQRAATN